MSENKQASAMAAKLAASVSKDTIETGPTTASLPTNPELPAGAGTDERAPGYYSMHTSKIRVNGKIVQWPMGSPFTPTCEEAQEILDSLVERGLAEKVEAPKAQEPSE